jgi:phenylacetate-CoA ligase
LGKSKTTLGSVANQKSAMSYWQQKIYPALPVPFQHAAVSAYGWKWMKRRFGGIYEEEYIKFLNRESFTADQWESYQTGQLRKILLHAWDTVLYYQQAFKNSGISRNSLAKFELSDLWQLPMLSKETLRKEGTKSLLSFKPEAKGSFFSSSGSTGTPTQICYSHTFHQRLSAAYEARVRNWGGVNRFTPRAMIGGRRVLPEGVAKAPFGRFNYFEKQLYLSAYHISRNTAQEYLNQIVHYKSEYMVGYAMSHFFLARFIDELNLEAPPMKAVLTSSEKLTPDMRGLFNKVYGCKTFDGWSGVENCGLISQTENDELLVSPDVGILEVIKSDGEPAQPGEIGELVCTGLLNFDQPLIRYKIGDQVRLRKAQTTRCGRSMPVIEEIIGRVEDVVIGKDGRELVRFHAIFINLTTVQQAQVVQESLNDFVVNVVPSGKLSETDKLMMASRMKSQLGEVNIEFKVMKSLPLGPGGKFKSVVSKIQRISTTK